MMAMTPGNLTPTELPSPSPAPIGPEQVRHTVIIGAGVIGCTTAYYLTRHPDFSATTHRITILEACGGVAPGASGKAGGLLARWARPEPLASLSYQLHAELAAEHGGAERWGYREVQCGVAGVRVGSELARQRIAMRDEVERGDNKQANLIEKNGDGLDNGRLDNDGLGKDCLDHHYHHNNNNDDDDDDDSNTSNNNTSDAPPWAKVPKVKDPESLKTDTTSALPPDIDFIDPAIVHNWTKMGATTTESATAQVHPLQFTTAMADLACKVGATILFNALVTSLDHSSLTSTSVTYTNRLTSMSTTIADATAIIVAAGPWTGSLLPRSKVSGLRAHSIVLNVEASPHAVFTSIQMPPDVVLPQCSRKGKRQQKQGLVVDPELYARPDGEVYVCGKFSTVPAPH